jgi:ubiquinone/menaquinone biosynthesis C-methylase UbiE
MPNPSLSRVKEVFEQWSMYDAVVQADYMAHKELVAALSEWAQRQTAPLRIVDLGCGDAWLATHAFKTANVAQYRGVDVSDSAVMIARDRVAALWATRAEVSAGNLAEFLGMQPEESATVILASYSLHHFLTRAKDELIADCHRVLIPGGTFFWIDPVCRPGESRDAYIDRLTNEMTHNWPALTPEQGANACAHVRESDFPETAEWMLDHVHSVGFHDRGTILQNDFFAGWEFVKS